MCYLNMAFDFKNPHHWFQLVLGMLIGAKLLPWNEDFIYMSSCRFISLQ